MSEFVDLNCDLGESYFNEKIGNDASIIPYISSCNIACGLHGGDPLTIQNAIDLALKNDVNIGAHPSFPDKQNFGRKFMHLSKEELVACLRFQIGAVLQMIRLNGGKMRHVKPHGALYNAAVNDFELASIIVSVIKEFDADLCLLGMGGSKMQEAAINAQIEFIPEVFADRNYTDQGSLVSREFDNAIIEDVKIVGSRCLKMVTEGTLLTDRNNELVVDAKSICVHGDTQNALSLVRSIHKAFELEKIEIKGF